MVRWKCVESLVLNDITEPTQDTVTAYSLLMCDIIKCHYCLGLCFACVYVCVCCLCQTSSSLSRSIVYHFPLLLFASGDFWLCLANSESWQKTRKRENSDNGVVYFPGSLPVRQLGLLDGHRSSQGGLFSMTLSSLSSSNPHPFELWGGDSSIAASPGFLHFPPWSP